ncbi:hypothetical protein ACXPWS_07710 [Mycobacterium sp. BMJ-28]
MTGRESRIVAQHLIDNGQIVLKPEAPAEGPWTWADVQEFIPTRLQWDAMRWLFEERDDEAEQ